MTSNTILSAKPGQLHIWNVFKGVTPRPNVSFDWNPNVVDAANSDIANVVASGPFYPTSPYVDWIGLDGYNKQQETQMNPPVWTPLGFSGVFGNDLSNFAADQKPVIIAETGSCFTYPSPNDQVSYLQSISATLQSNTSPFSEVKALMYFQAPGAYLVEPQKTTCQYTLGSPGIAELASLANTTFFSNLVPLP